MVGFFSGCWDGIGGGFQWGSFGWWLGFSSNIEVELVVGF